jgi:hypothetical protein
MRQTQDVIVNINAGRFAMGLMLGVFLLGCRYNLPSPGIDSLKDRFPVEVLRDCKIISSDLISSQQATIYMDQDHGTTSIKFAQPQMVASVTFSLRELEIYSELNRFRYGSLIGAQQYRKQFGEDPPKAPDFQRSAIEIISKSNYNHFIVSGQIIKCRNVDGEVQHYFFLDQIGGSQDGK